MCWLVEEDKIEEDKIKEDKVEEDKVEEDKVEESRKTFYLGEGKNLAQTKTRASFHIHSRLME